MRSFLLAAKIAAVFVVVMLVFTSLALHRFAGLVMHRSHHAGFDIGAAHDRFVLTVLAMSVVAVVCLVGFAVYLTAPLRRLSRSMDRIAAGDLEHRVAARGRDEIAAMGRSFNAMADRIRGMVHGQRELMAGVSHELRSPLARMKLSLELLRRDPSARVRIDALEDEVDELDGLVEELLLASRFDLGRVPLEATTVELDDAARRAWRRVAEPAERAGLTLELALAADAARVRADDALVVRVLGNLFENAVRHAGTGPVTIAATRRDDRVEVVVSDEGPGVATEALDRLFEPFFRTDPSRSRRTGAGGLGLMIVRRAVEAHGGRVAARLRQPRGLEIVLDLPGDPASTDA